MKAFALIKNGKAREAFDLREMPDPEPQSHEVQIEVEAFGLNFADVMARLGLYQDCPPLPAVIGYEVVGRILKTGSDVEELKPGQRVTAFTRFGAYATKAVTDQRAATVIPDSMPAGEAAALATQYCTAYYAAEEMVRLHEGNHVVIQAAAGGVGTALVQLARRHNCIIYGAAGSDEKLKYLQEQGVHHPINYRKADFYESVRKIMGNEKPDVIFNSLGGKTVRDGLKLLGPGGRIVCYGNAETAGEGSKILGLLKTAWGFGLLFPPTLLLQSKAIIGVYMLPIADHKPDVLQRCLKEVVQLYNQGEIKPTVGGIYDSSRLPEAHEFLESRKSVGKIIVEW